MPIMLIGTVALKSKLTKKVLFQKPLLVKMMQGANILSA
jgi:hypothetical protein